MNVRRHEASLALRLMLRDIERDQEEHAMPKGQLTTPEQVEAIQAGRRAGEPVTQIAARLGVSTKTVTMYTPPELLPKAKPGSLRDRTGTSWKPVAPGRKPRVDGYRPSPISVRKATPDELEHFGRPVMTANPEPDRETIEVGDRLVAFKEPSDELRDAEPMNIGDVVRKVAAEQAAEAAVFPMIRSLVNRQRKYAQLLKLAEQSGDEDIQLMVMDKMKMTALEQEAVALWELSQPTQGRNGAGNGRAASH